MWVRGLKPAEIDLYLYITDVAPHVGAWIETFVHDLRAAVKEVAPHVGAWIETLIKRKQIRFLLSHPMWVRGLKP